MENIINCIFFLNPVFILFTDFPGSFATEKKMMELGKRIKESDTIIRREMEYRDSSNLETTLINHKEAIDFRNQFKAFWDNKFYYQVLELEEIPITLITFILSVFISTDLQFWPVFYKNFQGKIPAILQFCLETFQPGFISDYEKVQKIKFLADHRITIYELGLGGSFMDWEDIKKGDSDQIFLWFRLLQDHFNSSDKAYMEWVELNPVPINSMNKNYLYGLTVDNNEIIVRPNSYFNECSQEQKEIYSMLAWVLDCICINEDKLPISYPHKDLCGKFFDEKEMMTKFIYFIAKDCKNYLA